MSSSAIRSFRDLRVWRSAMDLVEATYRASAPLPTSERYGLVSQMRRAAVSVASNIAEGHARALGDYVRFVLVAAGSLAELATQVEVSVRLGLMLPEHAGPLLQRCDELGRMLWSLRKRLQARRTAVP